MPKEAIIPSYKRPAINYQLPIKASLQNGMLRANTLINPEVMQFISKIKFAPIGNAGDEILEYLDAVL